MNKSLQAIFLAIFFITVVAFVSGCAKTASTVYPAPVVGTNIVVSNLTSTTVTAGGIIFDVDNVTANGVCYSSSNATPSVSDSKTTDTVRSHWVSNITGLTPNTKYYVRAYATSASGTGYGDVVTFTTNATAAVPTGTVTTLAGSASGNYGYAEGTGSGALFDGPQFITYNATSGLLYVSDNFNNVIRTVTTAGTTQTLTNPTIGFTNGPLATAQFYGPRGIAFDAQGNAYVSDIGNNVIRKITTTGVVSTLAGTGLSGYIDGAGTIAEFYNPQGVATDAAGNVYVADRTNNLIRKITPAGVVSVLSGYRAAAGYSQTLAPGWYDGDTNTSLFNYPSAVSVDASGNVYVADTKNKAIRKVSPTGDATTYAGGLNFPDLLGTPTAVVVDTKGNLFIADNTGRILELTPAKVLYVLAGASNTVGYANGVGAAATFSSPAGLTLDAQGNLYVADLNNNVIRKIVVTVQ